MSGSTLPLRSLWFGDGFTSATMQESGRSSDTSVAMRETMDGFVKEFMKWTTKSAVQLRIVQKGPHETS